MRLKVGLTTSDLTSLKHKYVLVSSPGKCVISFVRGSQISDTKTLSTGELIRLEPNGKQVAAKIGVAAEPITCDAVEVASADNKAILFRSIKRQNAKGFSEPSYIGKLIVTSDGTDLRAALETDLDTYVKGVLQSEIPGSYHLEAIKAQAVAARTYALRPRIDHGKDGCQVCDSYLCCQYFAGNEKISARHLGAIESTAGQIVTFEDKPILALFSSCAGGHTESYVDCFSDPATGAFPPPPLPYLTGVPEGKLPFDATAGVSEKELRKLYAVERPATADAWSPHFRWNVSIGAGSLEAQMHHQVDVLRKDAEMAPFIVPPPSQKFGHIAGFEVTRRGIAGTAIELAVKTSTGIWTVKKELVIRSIFKNSEIRLARLKSAKIFFDIETDKLGMLSQVMIYGFGWGHGVGLQQTGAQGHALAGKTYRQILTHYFSNVQISRV
jgi:SpoIID/LytB domain protein